MNMKLESVDDLVQVTSVDKATVQSDCMKLYHSKFLDPNLQALTDRLYDERKYVEGDIVHSIHANIGKMKSVGCVVMRIADFMRVRVYIQEFAKIEQKGFGETNSFQRFILSIRRDEPTDQSYPINKIKNSKDARTYAVSIGKQTVGPSNKISGWVAIKNTKSSDQEWFIAPRNYFERFGRIPDYKCGMELIGLDEVNDHSVCINSKATGYVIEDWLTNLGFEILEDPIWYFDERFK